MLGCWRSCVWQKVFELTFILPETLLTFSTYDGSINEIKLRINLDGGVGEASFQPSGFSRPNSYCEGTPFTPPRNTQKSIDYIDNKKHYQNKEQ